MITFSVRRRIAAAFPYTCSTVAIFNSQLLLRCYSHGKSTERKIHSDKHNVRVHTTVFSPHAFHSHTPDRLRGTIMREIHGTYDGLKALHFVHRSRIFTRAEETMTKRIWRRTNEWEVGKILYIHRRVRVVVR